MHSLWALCTLKCFVKKKKERKKNQEKEYSPQTGQLPKNDEVKTKVAKFPYLSDHNVSLRLVPVAPAGMWLGHFHWKTSNSHFLA